MANQTIMFFNVNMNWFLAAGEVNGHTDQILHQYFLQNIVPIVVHETVPKPVLFWFEKYYYQ